MRKFTATEAQDLCEIIEERSIDKSIAFTSQLPVDHWNEVIPDTLLSQTGAPPETLARWVHLPETGRVHYEKSCNGCCSFV